MHEELDVVYSRSVPGFGLHENARSRRSIPISAPLEMAVMLIPASDRGWRINKTTGRKLDGIVTLERAGRTETFAGLGFTRLSGGSYSRYWQTDKPWLQGALEEAGVPVPRRSETIAVTALSASRKASGREGVRRMLKLAGSAVRFPVVVKPSRGWGGKGVVVGIRSIDQLERVTRGAANGSSLYFEEMVGGEDTAGWHHYRICTLDGMAMGVYRRLLPAVLGNGRSTIGELLQTATADRRRIGWAELANQDELVFASKHGLSPRPAAAASRLLGRIPARGERLELGKTINMHAGGTAEYVPHSQWAGGDLHDLCRRVHSIFPKSFRAVGIDLIARDLNASFSGYVNEVNPRFGMGLPFKAAGQRCPFWLADKYLDALDM